MMTRAQFKKELIKIITKSNKILIGKGNKYITFQEAYDLLWDAYVKKHEPNQDK